MDEDICIYRGEVLAIMGALADMRAETHEILSILLGYDEDGNEEKEVDS